MRKRTDEVTQPRDPVDELTFLSRACEDPALNMRDFTWREDPWKELIQKTHSQTKRSI